MTTLAVGSAVWYFDQNYRVYPKNGGIGNSPIFREHFRPIKIEGETSRSWVLADGRKISKATLVGIYIDQDAIDRECWIHDHKWRIIRSAERINDYDTLRKLAELVGYDDTAKPA